MSARVLQLRGRGPAYIGTASNDDRRPLGYIEVSASIAATTIDCFYASVLMFGRAWQTGFYVATAPMQVSLSLLR